MCVLVSSRRRREDQLLALPLIPTEYTHTQHALVAHCNSLPMLLWLVNCRNGAIARWRCRCRCRRCRSRHHSCFLVPLSQPAHNTITRFWWGWAGELCQQYIYYMCVCLLGSRSVGLSGLSNFNSHRKCAAVGSVASISLRLYT